MTFPDGRTLNILLTTLIFAVVVFIMYVARSVLVIFSFAILFAYLIDPVVQLLQRHSLFYKNLKGTARCGNLRRVFTFLRARGACVCTSADRFQQQTIPYGARSD